MSVLEDIFSKYINELTIRKLPRKRYSTLPQTVFINYLLDKLSVFQDKGKIIYDGKVKIYLNKYAKKELILSKDPILEELKNEKHIVVDLSLLYLHAKKELNRLKIQLQETLNVVRSYLFDTNLIFISENNLNKNTLIQGKNLVITQDKKSFIEKYREELIYLDPYSEKTLTERDIEDYKYFVIGGIVDKGIEIKYSTKYLYEDLGLESRRIEIFGDINGVPDRINRIADIILRTKYSNIPLKESIVLNMTKKDLYNVLLKNKGLCSSVDNIYLLLKYHRDILSKMIQHLPYSKNFNCLLKFIYDEKISDTET